MDPPEAERAGGAAAVHTATNYCDNCRSETEHRIHRIDPRGASDPSPGLRGNARCRVCRWTHAFRSEPRATVSVAQVVSDGRESRHGTRTLPKEAVVERDTVLAGSVPPMQVRRIDRRDGRAVPRARVVVFGSLWLVPVRGVSVAVSVVVGRRTRSVRYSCPRDRPIAVGAALELEGRSVRVVGLRARGRTWKVPGDSFPAGEVDRVYARRTVIPPAGSSRWSSDRVTPSSRASSTSRAGRSRSSPGVSTART